MSETRCNKCHYHSEYSGCIFNMNDSHMDCNKYLESDKQIILDLHKTALKLAEKIIRSDICRECKKGYAAHKHFARDHCHHCKCYDLLTQAATTNDTGGGG